MRRTVMTTLALAAGLLLVLACTPTGGPEVTIVTPEDGAALAKGSIPIKAVATDDAGMSKVEFYVDGNLEDTDNSGTADTFAGTWDASSATTGSHTIKAKAYNADNKTSEDQITVTVGGTGPTEHSGSITEDETWEPAGNPHIITGDVSVINGATLTIKPGCLVKFKSGTELYCGYNAAGAIFAVGKPESLITFTSNAASPTPGDWQSVGAYEDAMSTTEFKYCNFSYGGGSSGYGTFYVNGASPKFDYCNISQSGDYGVVVIGDGRFSSFINNTITSCAKYPVEIQGNHAGTLGAGNTLTGNASGYDAIKISGDVVEENQTWLNHGVPYVVKGDINVSGAVSPVLTIAAGTTIKLDPNVEFYCGYNQAGAIVAVGTASQPITFTSSASSPTPGSWTAVEVYDQATTATEFKYCNFSYGGSSSGYGTFYVRSARPKFDNCNISQSGDIGVYVESDGRFSSFTNNTITSCAKYPVRIQANHAGTLGSDNTLTGNASGYDAIEITNGQVEVSQTWLNHGVPYRLADDVNVSGAASPELTIAPSTVVQLQPEKELYCGYNQPGAIIADGTSGRITFTSSKVPPEPGDWYAIEFYDDALATSKLVNCKIEYGGDYYGNIFIRNSRPTIANDSIGHSSQWGIYLEGTVYPSPTELRNNNTFYDCPSGEVREP